MQEDNTIEEKKQKKNILIKLGIVQTKRQAYIVMLSAVILLVALGLVVISG